MEKLLKRIEEQKQGRVATKNDIGEIYHQDGYDGTSLGASATEGYDNHLTQPKVRKVTQGPPPPIYKGFSKVEDLNSVHHKPTSSALEVRVIEDSSKNSKHRSSSSKWQAQNDGDHNKKPHNGRTVSHVPPPVVRKVAAYNEEAHKRNSGLLTTDAWRHTTHPERTKHSTAVAITNGPSKEAHIKKQRAGAAMINHPETNNREGVSSPVTVSDQPSLRPPSKTAREILAEIQDEHKEIVKQLVESKATKKRKPPKDKEAAVENGQREQQEQVVSKTKNYDTDSVRQYMARKRELERLRDRKNQEEERRKREDKERRLKDLEKKRREAATKAVKRPVVHPDLDKPPRGSSAHSAKTGGGSMGEISASANHDIDGTVGPHSQFASTRRAQEVCHVLNSSHESSDKENSKKTMHTPANLANELVPHPSKTATLPASSQSSNYQNSKPNRNFNVSDLLNSTSNTFDGDSSQIGRTAVQNVASSRTSEGHARESISTSEVHEQLRRSKALLAELNMKRMGIPTTLGTRKEAGLDDTNFSGDSTLDSKQKPGLQANNKEMMASVDFDTVSSTKHPLATDFNDRLMKLSKTANDLRNRLSNETKILADKIPKPIDETSHNDDVIAPVLPPKSKYQMKKVILPHKSGDDGMATEDVQDEFQIPPNEVGWNGKIGAQVNGNDDHAKRQYKENSKNFGNPLKYRKPGSSKRQNFNNDSAAPANGGSSAKQFKWQLPEPKLHVMQMPNSQKLNSEYSKLDTANSSCSNTRVSARTVVQHISKAGNPSTSTAVFSTNVDKLTGAKEDLDAYIKRLLQEAELHSPESAVANHAHVISNYFSGAQFPQSESFLQSRIGGGDPFSVINIYTKQKAEELAKSSRVIEERQLEAAQKGQLSLDLELMSTDEEGLEDTESHSNNDPQNVSIGNRTNDDEEAVASVTTSKSNMTRRSPVVSMSKDRRLSSTSSVDVSEIAEAVVQEQKHRRALSPRTSGGMNQNTIADYQFAADRFSPATLEQKLLSELNFLESMSDSMHQLTDAEKIYAVANVQQETVALSQILKARQQAHESDLKELATKARQEAEEASRQLREAQQKANYAALEAGLMQKKSEAELNLLARSEQLLSSQQKAAEATANAVDQLVNLSSKARYVEGAESAEADVTGKQQGPSSSKLPQSSSTFSGPTAQEIATTAAIAAARAVVAETLKQSMSKVSPSRKDDSSSSPFQSRLRTPTGSASSTPTEMLSPRSMSKRSSIHRKSYSTDPEMRSNAQSPLSSPRGASEQVTPKASKASHQPTRSSISEELVYSLSARKSQSTPSVQDKKVVVDNQNLDDSRTIYTEKYSEVLSEASSLGEREKLIPDKSEVESDISFSDEIGNASLHSIGSLQPVEGAQKDSKNISASIQEETKDSLASKPPLSPKRKAVSPHSQSVKSLISRSESVHSQYSTDMSSRADSPRHHTKSAPTASKSKSAAEIDASVATADYTEDFEVTKDGFSKTASAMEDVHKKASSSKITSRSTKAKNAPIVGRSDSPLKENSESGLWSVASAEDVEFSEEMLKQYLREEERRAQHQAALIKLREKAIKEKASAEMDYLDQLKLKSKGDAERMTTIKKRQRAVVIKLQEEQAELRRLELANKAGYQQRQLLLVQQREIAKMRNNTHQLKNKIKQLESASILEEGLESTSVGGKRAGVTSSYLKSSKIKELKKELVEEERRLSSLEKNTASSSEVNTGKSGTRKASGELNDVRSDSSSIMEDIDNQKSKRGSHPNTALDSSVTTNRSLSEVDDYGSSQARLPASIISSPRSLLSNSHLGKIKLSPRTKSPILPSAQDIAPTSSYSDASDIEGRIQALKEDLRKRKEEAERLRQLKRGKKSRDREHARLQEESIKKQLKYYEDYIEKTTAELEKADSEVGQNVDKSDKHARPVIKTPSAKSSISSLSGSFLKPSDSEPEAVKSIGKDVERYSDARSESAEAENAPSVIRSKGESEFDDSKTKESELDEKVKESNYEEKVKTIDDASIAESIDHESNSSTLEEDVSHSLSKPQTQESDATPLGSPRASTPVMSKESTPVMSKEIEVNETSESLHIDVQSIHSVPEENIRSSIHSLHEENASFKDSTAPISDDESLRKSDREEFPVLVDPNPSILVGSKVSLDDDKVGFVKFKGQVKDKYFIGIELEGHSEPHDLRCDEFFTCDTGSGVLTTDFDRVSLFKEKTVEQPLDVSVVPDINKEEVSYAGDGDYSLDFDDKTTATATTPRVVASVHSIKEEISFEENDDVSSESSSIAVRSIHADVVSEPEKSEVERHEKSVSEKSETGKSEISDTERGGKTESEKDEKIEMENCEVEKSERSKTESKIPEAEDSDKEDLSVSLSIHEIEPINVAGIIETVEPGKTHVVEPEICSLLDEKASENSEKKDSSEISFEEPPVVRLDPILSEEDADACCNQVFDSVFEEIMDEVFEDRELHIGFVNDLSEEMSNECMEKALTDTLECRETKRQKLENKNSLPPLFLDEEPAGEVDKTPSPVLEGDNLKAKEEESSVSEIIPDVPEKPASISQIPESSPPMSPTLGLTGEFIDDDFGLSVAEPSDKAGPIVPPIDISEITSAPEVGIQKPELPSSGISVEEAALSARLSVHAERIASLVEPQIFVPSKPEEMKTLSNTFSSFFFEQRSKGCDLAEVKIPLELLGSESVANDDVSRCKKYFKSMLFELVREIVMDVYATEPPVSHSWMKPKLVKKVHYHGLRPKSVEFLNEIVEKKVMNLVNLSVRPQHRSQTLKFGHKRRDLVDKILIQELREEESQWVDYNNDELNVKMQLTDAIFDSLIEDTVNVLNTIQSKHTNQSVM